MRASLLFRANVELPLPVDATFGKMLKLYLFVCVLTRTFSSRAPDLQIGPAPAARPGPAAGIQLSSGAAAACEPLAGSLGRPTKEDGSRLQHSQVYGSTVEGVLGLLFTCMWSCTVSLFPDEMTISVGDPTWWSCSPQESQDDRSELLPGTPTRWN